MEPPLTLHRRLDLSDRRRLFAVTDVHGEYPMLERHLADLGWNPDRDALIINGDLCDRGEDSLAAFDWIARPNVHRTLGNHDVMPEMYLDDECDEADMRDWGAAWFLDLDHDRRRELAVLLAAAPHSLTVTTPLGRTVGFVHADCGDDWSEHVSTLEGPPSFARHQITKRALWSRNTIMELMGALRPEDGSPSRPYSCRVTGVDHVFHGHTTVARAFAHHDRTWFDTGACFERRRMTVIDVDSWLDDIDRNSPFI